MASSLFTLGQHAARVASSEISNDLAPSSSLDERWNLRNLIWSDTHTPLSKTHKPYIGFQATDDWPWLEGDAEISADGQYFAYPVFKGQGIWTTEGDAKIVVQSVNGSWRQELTSVDGRTFNYPDKHKRGIFSGNGERFIFQDRQGLCFLKTGGNGCYHVDGVKTVKVPPNGCNDWLACQLDNKDLVLCDLSTGKETRFINVAEYAFDASGRWLVCRFVQGGLVTRDLADGHEQQFSSVSAYQISPSGEAILVQTGSNELYYADLRTGRISKIWQPESAGNGISGFQWDGTGRRAVFTITDTLKTKRLEIQIHCAVGYWEQGMETAAIAADDRTSGVTLGLTIAGNAAFIRNSRCIVFDLQAISNPKATTAISQEIDDLPVKLDIWSYKDSTSRFHQMQQPPSRTWQAVYNLNNNKLIYFAREGEQLGNFTDDYGVITLRGDLANGDRYWEKNYQYDSIWVLALADGSRKWLAKVKRNGTTTWLSPGGKYLVIYDEDKQCSYFSYEFSTGRLINISKGVRPGLFGFKSEGEPARQSHPFAGIGGWLEKDAGILVYDNEDIWQLDLSGKQSPINITAGYGHAHHIILALMRADRRSESISQRFKVGDTLVLRAFNTRTKYSGFFRKRLGDPGNPEQLSMMPCFMFDMYGSLDMDYAFEEPSMQPKKADAAATWIIRRQSAREAPNYFKTTDLRTFERLTDYQPQKAYNWLTDELHQFKNYDGTPGRGILYKPENFDPAKKYPVLIIWHGNQNSDRLNLFPQPESGWGPTVPVCSPIFFLNKGYLVFVPDLTIAPLKYGPLAFNSFEGAVSHLKTLPYVDGNHIGAASHSWGAKLASYIFTHSRSLAAMAISEGFVYADPIRTALSDLPNDVSALYEVEKSFEYGNLWQNKSTWLDQTTVWNVDKATSPLLLFSGKREKEYTDQTAQLFNALRRLDKKAWWLQYEHDDHNIMPEYGNSQKDFLIRYTQFYDHYLQAAPAPLWMTHGLPHTLNGVESRLELDPAGSCGPDCKICRRWNEQYKKHPKMFSKPVSEWHLSQP